MGNTLVSFLIVSAIVFAMVITGVVLMALENHKKPAERDRVKVLWGMGVGIAGLMIMLVTVILVITNKSTGALT